MAHSGRPIDFRELGIRPKVMAMTKIDSEPNEDKHMIGYLLEEDEEYPLATFDGAPEFSFNDREQFMTNNDDDLPSISLTSNTGPHDLPPQPAEHTLIY